MYANEVTGSMQRAIDETERRREKQITFNEEHGIEPMSIVKAVRDLTDQIAAKAMAEERAPYEALTPIDLPEEELVRLIDTLEDEMNAAAESLEFEKAAALRDQIYELREALAEKQDLKPWERARALAGYRRS